jgi:hypothetical protein
MDSYHAPVYFFTSIVATQVLKHLAGSHNASKFSGKGLNTADDVNICTVSAPGKALIAGGYLVTDYPNVGVVVAATSRFYSTVKANPDNSSRNPGQLTIRVHSPQFHTAYTYIYDTGTGAGAGTQPTLTCVEGMHLLSGPPSNF